jgi:hypothetical protein
MLSVCLHISLINVWIAEPIFMKLGIFIMAPEPNSMAYFTNNQSLCLHVYSPIVARQRLSKNGTAATNTHATTEESLEGSFPLRSVLYRRTQAISSCCLLDYVFLTFSNTGNERYRVLDWKECVKKLSWPNLRHCPSICLEELRTTTNKLSQDTRYPGRD